MPVGSTAKMRVVLLGAPGSGKGTQARLVAERYGVPQLSTGDLLRAAVAAGSPLGLQIKSAMDTGLLLVPDELVLGVIGERLAEPDAGNGFILDGFPRTQAQAQALDVLLDERGIPLHLVLLIDVDVDALIQRLTGRRTCVSCGRVYNVYTNPSRLEDRCDECGGNLRHRADDNEETIGNRLRVYEAQTTPLTRYYEAQGKLRRVRGAGEIQDIFQAVCAVLDPLAEPPGGPPQTEPSGREERPAAPSDAAEGAGAATKAPAARSPRRKIMPAEGPVAGAASATPSKRRAVDVAASGASAAERAADKKRVKPSSQAESAPSRKVATSAVSKKVSRRAAPAKGQGPVRGQAAAVATRKGVTTKKPGTVAKAPARKAREGLAQERKSTAKKLAPKKAAPKKAAPKRAAPKRPEAKKKAAPKRAAPKRAAPKKALARKAAPKRAAPKKAAPRKAAPRTAAPKKAPARKAVRTRGAAAPPKKTPASGTRGRRR
jgi:adenylate kinase